MCFLRKAKGLGKMSPVNLILPVFMKVKNACVFSFTQELWESHLQNEQFLKNCIAADNLPLKIVSPLRQHTLLLSGFNLGCSMKREPHSHPMPQTLGKLEKLC